MTKTPPQWFVYQLLICCLIFVPLSEPWAEVTGVVEDRLSDAREWSASIKHWDATFAKTDIYLKENTFNETTSDELYGAQNKIHSHALSLKNAVDSQREAVTNLLTALGSKPSKDEPNESPLIASKRAEYEEQLSVYRELLAQIDLALVRTSEQSDGLSALRRDVLVEKVFTRLPSPIDPKTVYSAFSQSIGHIQSLILTPGLWYDGLDTTEKQRLAIWPTVFVTAFSLLLGLFMRSWIIRTYGRDAQNEIPSQTLKVSAAIAEGVGRGVVPLLTLLGVALWIAQHASAPVDLFADMLKSGFNACVYFVVFSSLLNAVLSPSHPSWRLIDITPSSTRVIGSAALLLLAVIAVDQFIVGSTDSMSLSPSVQTVYLSLVVVLQSALILAISIGRWWEAPESETEDEQTDGEVDEASNYLDYFRRFVVVFCMSAVVASVFGYAKLSIYLVENLVNSVLIVLLTYGTRAILLEVVAAFTSSKVVRQRLGMRLQTLQRARLWVGGLLSVALFVCAVAGIAITWGVAAEDMYRWVIYLFTGFSVGSITISLTEILIAVMVFVGVMVVTKLIQRVLMNSVLPQFTTNRSVQHSLSSGTGYIGILIASTMFIAALGIKLQSIALVAGALSVGIGFGLQNIVNNFVSGLILILERPIKVGDWVRVSGNEGFVQQINFRATELETFTRATVIIPNSEMLSNSLTNMTYHNKTSRLEILVQVAYGSEPEQVMTILKDAANQQAQVLRYPEAFVLLVDFAADGLNFELRCYVRDATMKLSVSSAIRLKVLEVFTSEGIDIPFPQRVLHIATSTDSAGTEDSPNLPI